MAGRPQQAHGCAASSPAPTYLQHHFTGLSAMESTGAFCLQACLHKQHCRRLKRMLSGQTISSVAAGAASQATLQATSERHQSSISIRATTDPTQLQCSPRQGTLEATVLIDVGHVRRAGTHSERIGQWRQQHHGPATPRNTPHAFKRQGSSLTRACVRRQRGGAVLQTHKSCSAEPHRHASFQHAFCLSYTQSQYAHARIARFHHKILHWFLTGRHGPRHGYGSRPTQPAASRRTLHPAY